MGQPMSDTGSGILVGAEPAQPRTTGEWGNQPRPDQAVTQQPPPRQQQQPERPAYRWTDEDIENARRQEKDKLYPQLDEMKQQLRALQEQRDTEQAERQRLADEAEAARKAREEQEMEVRDLLTRREQEWKSQIEELSGRFDTYRAVSERERQLAEAELYRRDRIAQEAENILPELRDFITGSTPEEVDQSIEAMKQRTEQIVANFVAAEPQIPFQPRIGASPTAPPVGPMETQPDYTQLTPEDIRGMDMNTYKRYREQLLQATSPRNRRAGG